MAVSALGLVMLAIGSFVEGGWPLIVCGFLLVVAAAGLRHQSHPPAG